MEVVPTVRKLNIVDIVFYLSLRCVGVKITILAKKKSGLLDSFIHEEKMMLVSEYATEVQ
jgi:hypothetical protein